MKSCCNTIVLLDNFSVLEMEVTICETHKLRFLHGSIPASDRRSSYCRHLTITLGNARFRHISLGRIYLDES